MSQVQLDGRSVEKLSRWLVRVNLSKNETAEAIWQTVVRAAAHNGFQAVVLRVGDEVVVARTGAQVDMLNVPIRGQREAGVPRIVRSRDRIQAPRTIEETLVASLQQHLSELLSQRT